MCKVSKLATHVILFCVTVMHIPTSGFYTSLCPYFSYFIQGKFSGKVRDKSKNHSLLDLDFVVLCIINLGAPEVS